MSVPYDRLGIPKEHRASLGHEAPAEPKLAIARGDTDLPPDVRLSMLYVLVGDSNPTVRASTEQAFKTWSEKGLLAALNPRTHPKILEYVVEHRRDAAVRMRVYSFANMNDRTARAIARDASGDLLENVLFGFERMLMTPKVFLDLKRNPNVTEEMADRAAAFLRMQNMLPEDESDDGVQGGPRVIREGQEGDDAFRSRRLVRGSDARDVQAEVEAALLGLPSPYTNQKVADRLDILVLEDQATAEDLKEHFVFSFEDEAEEFANRLTTDGDIDSDERKGIGALIADLSVGKKIKLAYLGNAEARKVLLRDTNKSVAVAVVKSGRLSDGEAAQAAGNKNLHMDVIREIAANREYARKYTVKVQLANNPKTPVSLAVGLISGLHRADLTSLARNKNISSVVSKMAHKIMKQRTENAASGKG